MDLLVGPQAFARWWCCDVGRAFRKERHEEDDDVDSISDYGIII